MRFATSSVASALLAVAVVFLFLASVGAPAGVAGLPPSGGSLSSVGPSAALAMSPGAVTHQMAAVHPGSGTPNTLIATINVPGGPTSLSATFDPTNGYIYFGSNGTNVTAIDGATNQIVDQIYVGPYASPATPNYVGGAVNDIYAPVISTDPPQDNVSVISGSTNVILKYLPTGRFSEPTTGVYDPDNGYLYVPALGDNQSHVTVINTATNTVQTTIGVGDFPTTPAYDPADGDVYVPNTFYSNNLTIINASTDTTVGSVSITFPSNSAFAAENMLTESPVYDPVTRAIYEPDTGNVTLTEVQGTSLVRNFTVGPAPQTPAVDPVTGNLFVPIALDSLGNLGYNVSIVNVTSNAVTTVYVCEDPETPVYDPANNEMYVPCLQDNSNYGAVAALNATTGSVVALINVGVSPVVPAFDSTNDELYVPNFVSNNVSVIGAGPLTSPPGTYPVTFTESGLPSGEWWSVMFLGTTLNETSSSIVFTGVANGSYTFTLGPYGDSTCIPTSVSASGTGSFKVNGAPTTVDVTFNCGGSGTGSSGGSPLFLGLPGDEGYILIAVIAAVAVAVVAIALIVRSRGRRGPGAGPPSSPPTAAWTPPPPGAWTPPPPPPPPPPP